MVSLIGWALHLEAEHWSRAMIHSFIIFRWLDYKMWVMLRSCHQTITDDGIMAKVIMPGLKSNVHWQYINFIVGLKYPEHQTLAEGINPFAFSSKFLSLGSNLNIPELSETYFCDSMFLSCIYRNQGSGAPCMSTLPGRYTTTSRKWRWGLIWLLWLLSLSLSLSAVNFIYS